MFNVGDYIVYRTVGVCVVKDICSPDFVNDDKKYYILDPISERGSIFYLPVDNHKVFTRRVMTKDEADEFIEKIPSIPSAWFNDKDRSNEMNAMLQTGACSDWVSIIKGLHHLKDDKEKMGKKLSTHDTNTCKHAEVLLSEELSVALGVSMDKVNSYIKNGFKN